MLSARRATGGAHKPLSLREWNDLAGRIRTSSLGRPAALLCMSQSEISHELGASEDLAQRIAHLLARGGQLAFEMERLANRGIWLVTRADSDYPQLWKERLREKAPPVLFGAGERETLHEPGIAIVGSRNADERGLNVAMGLGRGCVRDGRHVVSGAARGVDRAAMAAALEAGGRAVGVLADSLERMCQQRDMREPIIDGALTLVTPYHPAARFNVGHAMRRNALIYCLAESAIVVSSTLGKGGTTAGAIENLRHAWVPLFVVDDGSDGNRDLIARGASPIDAISTDAAESLTAALASARDQLGHEAAQLRAEDPPPSPPDLLHDLFGRVWPSIAASLDVERSELEVAQRFQLEPTQARAWLERAVDEGRAVKLARPRRYRAAAPSSSGHDARTPPDLFAIAWPSLATLLSDARSEREVRARVHLTTSQTRAWLKRAVAEGRAIRVKPAGRYTTAGVQRSLFEGD